MEDQNQNSSITILLIICVAVIVIVGFGWFLLDNDGGSDDVEIDTVATAPDPIQSELLEDEDEVAPTAVVDVDLRKARLAAEADILSTPAERSALNYYGRVINANPDHEVANAELDAVLGRLAVTAADLLAAKNFDEAYTLAQKVAPIRPDHALVDDIEQTLDRVSGELVIQAMHRAEEGDNDGAMTILAQAESLPGRNRDYFEAVRESIADLLQARSEADAQKAETERLEAARAVRTWMETVRGAIADGRLIDPPGDNARDFFAERSEVDEIAEQIQQELYSAILGSAFASVESGALEDAEKLVIAGESMAADADEVFQLRASLEQKYIEREGAIVRSINDLVRVSTAPARYPRRAEQLGISGWVEVLFTVTTSGETADIVVANAEPESVFDDSAVAAVEKWKFEPREYRGQLIAQRTGARLAFRLQ